jgi:hypothetical protein
MRDKRFNVNLTLKGKIGNAGKQGLQRKLFGNSIKNGI